MCSYVRLFMTFLIYTSGALADLYISGALADLYISGALADPAHRRHRLDTRDICER
jgi:hypothetical protein